MRAQNSRRKDNQIQRKKAEDEQLQVARQSTMSNLHRNTNSINISTSERLTHSKIVEYLLDN
eukprot:snap_masked-scaffold_23-processed-gene-4.30-mRNA-1 protein AED:1.00 eAED:1.00 QI:0/-1/0/0/-1/1/1/0/61